jgi:cullin-5
LSHEDDEALLRAYINVWSKFFDQTIYLPLPFTSMEVNSTTKANSSAQQSQSTSSSSSSAASAKRTTESYVRKLMLDSWSKSIFSEIKYRLQNSAMKIVYSERIGEPFDSQLVTGVRESYGENYFCCFFFSFNFAVFNFPQIFKSVNLCSDTEDRLKIYKENFEKAYLVSMTEFYNKHAQLFITENGIISYLSYADSKMKEEEKRAYKYLETCKGSTSIDLVIDID